MEEQNHDRYLKIPTASLQEFQRQYNNFLIELENILAENQIVFRIADDSYNN